MNLYNLIQRCRLIKRLREAEWQIEHDEALKKFYQREISRIEGDIFEITRPLWFCPTCNAETETIQAGIITQCHRCRLNAYNLKKISEVKAKYVAFLALKIDRDKIALERDRLCDRINDLIRQNER